MRGLSFRSFSIFISGAIALALYTFPIPSVAQKYPTNRISIVTPVASGSPFDLLTRIFADRLQQNLDVPVIVENVPGAQGLIASQRVLNAAPDGQTILVASSGLLTLPLTLKD